MRDNDAYRLERIAAARLRVTLDHRLGRPTPESVIRLGMARTPDLDEFVRHAQLAITPPRPEDLTARWTRVLTAVLPVVPLLLVTVLTAWWRVEAMQPLLAGLGAAVVAGALPIGLLAGLTVRGFWSSAWPTVLFAAWAALVPGMFGAGPAPAVLLALAATVLISMLGLVQNDLRIPRFDTRWVGAAVDLQPLVRYGLAAAGYGVGTVLSAVLAGLPAAAGVPFAVVVLATALTPLAYTVAVIGIQLAIALATRRHPRFGFQACVTTAGLLTLWHGALYGDTGWLITGCVVVLAAAGWLLVLIRQRASAGQMSR
jgi:hypothetical protein